MSLQRRLIWLGLVCAALAAMVALGLLVPSPALAAAWSSERIYSDPTKEVTGLSIQGDYVVWTTYSRADQELVDVYLYKISTKQTTRIAGPGLAYRVGFGEAALDGTHVVWNEVTGDGGSDVILYDIAAAQWTRLSAGAPETDEMDWSLEGDWLVWHGMTQPGPGDWAYDPAVFAYRISTSGPIQTIRWRDHETQQYPESYRSMDDNPSVSNGKLCWQFERPGGDSYLGVLDLGADTIGWTWEAPDGQGTSGLIGNDYVLIVNSFMAGQLYHRGLLLSGPGQSTPEVLVADISTYLSGMSIRGGVAVWAAGDVYYKKPGGAITKVANTSSVNDVSSDGSHLSWDYQGVVYWLDLSAGAPEQIPGAAGGDSAVSGSKVAWAGDYQSGGGAYHGAYLSSRGAQSFSDVPAGHPYASAIAGMASRGIIGGFEDGTFGPDKLVTRQQFAKMIVLTLGLPVTETDFPSTAVPFVDLGPDDTTKPYPHEYVAICALNNITKGTDATHFAPGANIKISQMVTMVVRAADNLAAGSLAVAPGDWNGLLSYSDPTHGANIKKAEYNGLLSNIVGPGGTLDSWNTSGDATRGEVAQVLWNLLQKLP